MLRRSWLYICICLYIKRDVYIIAARRSGTYKNNSLHQTLYTNAHEQTLRSFSSQRRSANERGVCFFAYIVSISIFWSSSAYEGALCSANGNVEITGRTARRALSWPLSRDKVVIGLLVPRDCAGNEMRWHHVNVYILLFVHLSRIIYHRLPNEMSSVSMLILRNWHKRIPICRQRKPYSHLSYAICFV